MKLRLYTIHHLNLCFSSIEEEQRPEVIQKCYWPLLRLAENLHVPVGIETPAYTLEAITGIDPSWTEKLKDLCRRGLVEFIGSGYAQIIAPLVPAEVNIANIMFGNQIYEKLLGFRPGIALVNEQAYSAGLIQHYLDTGYKAIVMEWDNPAKGHPEWHGEWRYYPQYACGVKEEKIPLIWNNSISFQKFQRYAHGDIEMLELSHYLTSHMGEDVRCFPLYGNDVEIFDFRPGRFHTEAIMQEESEWIRIGSLYETLAKDERFEFMLPGQVLAYLADKQGGNELRLESPGQPIPVKKQGKYNISRWAITGRDDLGINTLCWRMHDTLMTRENAQLPSKVVKVENAMPHEDWKWLSYFWSSDFRTHITQKRWEVYQEQLHHFKDRLSIIDANYLLPEPDKDGLQMVTPNCAGKIVRKGRFLEIRTKKVVVRLNCKKGLAIDRLWLDNLDGPFLCGTLEHGYYDDISFGADWYTGHTVFESIGQPKMTDLSPVEPEIYQDSESGDIVICGNIITPLGTIRKRLRVGDNAPAVEMIFDFDWHSVPMGSLRLGTITLNPEAFDRNSIYYQASNGGSVETFAVNDKEFDHGGAVSFMVSAQGGLGITDGRVIMGDAKRRIVVKTDHTLAALIGLMQYQKTNSNYFWRLSFSAGETDETRRLYRQGPCKIQWKVLLTAQ